MKSCPTWADKSETNRNSAYQRIASDSRRSAPFPVKLGTAEQNAGNRILNEMEMMHMGETYMYGVYDSAYVCKKCECSIPMNIDGEDASSLLFMYCPFCGREIKNWYADEASAEWFEGEQNET